MSEASLGDGVSKEVLSSVLEKKDTTPGKSEVFEAFDKKKALLSSQITGLEASPGVNLDILEAQKRRQDIADLQQELDQVDALWQQLGGGEIDAATDQKENLGFKADANDHIRANSEISDAKVRFYDNFLKEYEQSDPEVSEPLSIEVKDADDSADSVALTGEQRPVQPAKVINLNIENENNTTNTTTPSSGEAEKPQSSAESATSSQRLNETSDDKESTGGSGTKNTKGEEAENRFPTFKETLDNLKNTEVWKKASSGERDAMEQQLHTDWLNRKNQEEDVSGKGPEAEEANTGEDDNESQISEKDAVEALLNRIPDFDKKSPEEKAHYKETFEAFMAAGLIDASRLNKEEKAGRKAETEAKNEAIRKELGPEVDKTNNALKEYAKLKADHETKGFIGRRKRLESLKDAEMQLTETKIAYAKSLVEKRREAGLYEGDEESIKRQMADDMMNEMRLLDREARVATNNELKDRIENRKWYQKAAVSIGKFLNGGNKWYGRLARNAAPGFLAGFGVAVSGVGFPVTTAVGAGLGAAVYGFSRTTLADESLKAHESGAVLTDERAKEILGKIQGSTDNILDQARGFAGGILEESRKSGESVNRQNAKKSIKNLGMFSLGYAAGGMLGSWTHGALNSSGNPESSTTQTNPEGPRNNTPGPETNTRPETTLNHSSNINTNGAPEHGFRDILRQYGGSGGQNIETLFNEVYSQTGGNVFVDQAGNKIPMKDFGGAIGRGWTEWNLNKMAYLSEPAKTALRAKGFPV